MTIAVREALPEDAEILALLLRAINDEPGLHPERITAESVRRDLIGDPRVALLVAEAEGVVAGFVSGHHFYDSASSRWGMIIGDIYVAPEARRRGMGRALVAALAAHAARDGGAFLWWDADLGDELALAFHRGIGAEESASINFFLGNDEFGRLL